MHVFCSTLLYTYQMCRIRKLTPTTVLCRILRIRWQLKITNEKVLRRTVLTTMYTTISQIRLRYVLRMSDERIPKFLLYIWSLKNVMSVDQDCDTKMEIFRRGLENLHRSYKKLVEFKKNLEVKPTEVCTYLCNYYGNLNW